MQTFLPFRDFAKSALVLDGKRLSNQRRESKTLLSGGWPNHPAAKMWKGFDNAHIVYALAICDECVERDYKRSHEMFIKLCTTKAPPWHNPKMPPWLSEDYDYFHLTHQSNLVRKSPGHYAQMFPWVPDNLRYAWPRMQDGRLVGWYESYKVGTKQIQEEITIPSNEELRKLYSGYKA